MFENFDFLWKISIFGQKFRFWTKISIFDLKFRFSTKHFDRRQKIQSSTKNFDLWPNILISTRILWKYKFGAKLQFFTQISLDRSKFQLSTQTSSGSKLEFQTIQIFNPNFNGRPKFWWSIEISIFFTKISIFGKKIVKFSTEIPTFENCNYRN